jgi:hypothetical protein
MKMHRVSEPGQGCVGMSQLTAKGLGRTNGFLASHRTSGGRYLPAELARVGL